MRELIVDSFAGGGGASTGILAALGRGPDYAINHDATALAMHAANHPETVHLSRNVWQVDPLEVIGRRPVGLAWFSPDCKHFSKAKGGKPVKRSIRDLAWVVVLWAKRARPRVIVLENVEEFREWGPLVESAAGSGDWRPCPDRRGETFRRWLGELKRQGYKVEARELRACDYGAPTIRKRLFVIARRDGAPIVWPQATHGPPNDPAVLAGRKLPWRTAAEIIDWSIRCPSIFMDKADAAAYFAATGVRIIRPLAEKTMARIAKGVMRYVVDAAKPFIVSYYGAGAGGTDRSSSAAAPLHTVVTENRHAVVAPVLTYAQHGGRSRSPEAPLHTVAASTKDQNAVVAPFMVPRYGERPTQEPRTRAITEPAATIVPTGNGGSLVAACMVKNNFGDKPHYAVDEPTRTIVAGGQHHAVVAAHMMKFRGDSGGASMDDPAPTVTANSYVVRPGGAPPLGIAAAFLAQHNDGPRPGSPGRSAGEPVSTLTATGAQQAVVSAGLANLRGSDGRMSGPDAPAPTITAGGTHAADVRAFLVKYYGAGVGQFADDPLHTVTTRERYGLVLVNGEPYEIVDIGMRMLTPRELFRAQGFPDSYEIETGVAQDGSPVPLTKSEAIRMCGNSVCPPLAEAIVRSNCAELAVGYYGRATA